MERKVTEWGCMQALIDFDGWRKWKQYAEEKANEDPAKKAAEAKATKEKMKADLLAQFKRAPPSKNDRSSSASLSATERATTPVQNGTGKRNAAPSMPPTRSHKSSRSVASTGGGNLESMAEEDEGKH
jgi:hypothetical protein